MLGHGEVLVLMEYRSYVPAHSHLSVGQSLRQNWSAHQKVCVREKENSTQELIILFCDVQLKELGIIWEVEFEGPLDQFFVAKPISI